MPSFEQIMQQKLQPSRHCHGLVGQGRGVQLETQPFQLRFLKPPRLKAERTKQLLHRGLAWMAGFSSKVLAALALNK